MISIRTATLSDAPAITQLSFQLGYTISEAETLSNLQWLDQSSNDVVLVATDNEQVVGWMQILYTVRLETGAFCEIVGLVVDERQRSKGIGKMLIEKAVEWTKGRACNSLRVRTNVIRTDTHRFYANAGFKLAKEQKIFTMELG